ncbi:hypothetical protein SDC9_212707 [bioreactor metagenome]|uniref:Uncharacterized protein n=1 Tax=bioreactor metagenome TaxID=1076179 RepID=A0A645JMP5_9ZZZZ
MVASSNGDAPAILGYLDAAPGQFGPLRRGFVEDGIGVVDVDENLAHVPGQSVQPVHHAAGAVLRQVADVTGGLARQAGGNHLVVGPESAVDHHAIGFRHAGEDFRRAGAEAGGVEEPGAALLVGDGDADVVAIDR